MDKDCNQCRYLFTEYDEMERRCVSWCMYKSDVTHRMQRIERGFKCPKNEEEHHARM